MELIIEIFKSGLPENKEIVKNLNIPSEFGN